MSDYRMPARHAPLEPEVERRGAARRGCDQGHCGPFMNRSYYASLGAWGYGDCVECGHTVAIPRDRRDFEGMIEAIIPPV